MEKFSSIKILYFNLQMITGLTHKSLLYLKLGNGYGMDLSDRNAFIYLGRGEWSRR